MNEHCRSARWGKSALVVATAATALGIGLSAQAPAADPAATRTTAAPPATAPALAGAARAGVVPRAGIRGKRVRTVRAGRVRLRFRRDAGTGVRRYVLERAIVRRTRATRVRPGAMRRVRTLRRARTTVRVRSGRTYFFTVRGLSREGRLERRPRRADLVLRVRTRKPTGPTGPAGTQPAAPGAGADAGALGGGTPAVERLTVERAVAPLGIDTATPRFGWRMATAGRATTQSAYQLVVATTRDGAARGAGDVWDSGRVASDRQTDVEYGGPALKSTTPYFWAVRVFDAAGTASAWSAPSSFETAFLDPAEFKGSWIGRVPTSPSSPGTERPEPLLRKEFDLAKPVRSARLHISGLGYHEAAINGQRIGDHVLDPAFTVYDKTALYETHDVTQALREGENAIGVRLGRGFYATKTAGTFYQWYATSWNSDPKVKLQLDVTHTDGTVSTVTSDQSFKAADGPTTRDSVLLGEVYDARLEPDGWTEPGFSDTTWAPAVPATPPQGRLRAQTMDPIRVVGTQQPEGILRPKEGIVVYDFGIPLSGWSRVRLRGPAGTKVTFKYGEKLLQDGRVQHTGSFYAPDDQLQTDSYTLSGEGTETWEPRYSYKGFRYVQVESSGPMPEIVDLEARKVHSDVGSVGGFESSNPYFDKLHGMMRRTILANLHGIPTDTPMYEKNGWTADAHLISDSSIRNFDMVRFWEKWMQDIKDQQRPGGDLPAIVPTPPRGFGDLIDPVWAAAYIFINEDLYDYYGDERALRTHYDSMKAWMQHLETSIRGTEYIWEGFSFGDWVSPGNLFPPEGTRLAGTAYIYEQAKIMRKLATALGKQEDAAGFEALAKTIRGRFNEEFYNRQSGIYETEKKVGYRQGSNVFALSFGLVEESERKRVMENLVKDIMVEREGHLNTGAPSTKLLLPLLTDEGHGDVALQVATTPTYPGWGFWVSKGATNMWEFWEEGARSRQHAFMGTIDDWFFTHLAGIAPAGPAWSRITVKPHLIGDLQRASAHTETPRGRVKSSWRRTGDTLELDVEIPPNARGEISVPASDAGSVTEGGRAVREVPGVQFERAAGGYAVYSVGSGSYRFRSRP